jgi:hypothetical protein
VQLTWERNYETMSDLLGIDFVHHPDLALELDNATNIMFLGMSKGLFTGKSFSDYFCKTKEDWVTARKPSTASIKLRRSRSTGTIFTPRSATQPDEFFRRTLAPARRNGCSIRLASRSSARRGPLMHRHVSPGRQQANTVTAL